MNQLHDKQEYKSVGRRVTDRRAIEDILEIFEPAEGGINMYYGKIGNGKTYAATADVLDFLSQGRVVYTNWHVNYEGYDQRDVFFIAFWKFIFFRKRFYRFPKENLRYFDPDSVTIDFLSSITDADIFVDEGQWIFDSYEGTNFSKAKRRLILHTRHLNRSLNIISQRTQAIQVSARGQVNRFYKCQKILQWPFLIFRRTEFQDMQNNDVDETKPMGSKIYFASKQVLNAYNTKYLRGGIKKSQELFIEPFVLSFSDRFRLIYSLPLRSCLRAVRAFRRGGRKRAERAANFKTQDAGGQTEMASIKNRERLNTIPVGGIKSPYMDPKKDQGELPF